MLDDAIQFMILLERPSTLTNHFNPKELDNVKLT
jgi:hypothetical protein